MNRFRHLSLLILSVLFIVAGLNHFRSTEMYLRIMPEYLPRPLELVYLSGVFEVLGGIGLLIPRLRVAAGWGLIALLIAVFPANIQMLVDAEQFPMFPVWLLWLRLPIQGLLIAWVWWAAIRVRTTSVPAV